MAAQEQQAEALQVPALQQGLPQGGLTGAAHEITQVCPLSSHEASKYPNIEHFHLSGALNLMSAMSVDFSSLLKVTGRDMWQSTVETGMGM